jgi:lipooligosaccharide transport system permease protein
MTRGLAWCRGVALVAEGAAPRYRQNWRTCLVTGCAQPVLLLMALGLGVGGLLASSPHTERMGLEVPYVQYLAPAILVVGAVQTAVGEALNPVMAGLRGERTYYATVATPITPAQLALAHLLWVAVRLAATTACSAAAVLVLVDVPVAATLAAGGVAVLCGTAFAGVLSGLTAWTVEDSEVITLVTRVLTLPMILFSGAFFPFGLLPDWTHPLAWALPLWHGMELARGTGGMLPHLAYLLVFLAAGVTLTVNRFRWRLAA